jgi:hypothetical protein
MFSFCERGKTGRSAEAVALRCGRTSREGEAENRLTEIRGKSTINSKVNNTIDAEVADLM